MDTYETKRERPSGLSDIFKDGFYCFYLRFVKPGIAERNDSLRELLLKVVLLVSIAISVVLILFRIGEFLYLGRYDNKGSMLLLVGLFSIFVVLYIVSKKGFYSFVTFVLLATGFMLTIYIAYYWGIDAPQALLAYSVLIAIMGILVDFTASLIVIGLILLILLALGGLQIKGVFIPISNWKISEIARVETVRYMLTFGLIAAISWLFNFEISRALRRARLSEQALKQEKKMLEIRVQKRTEELRKLQIEKMRQLYRFAKLGKLSSGLFHDITNHLTALFLNLEHLEMITDQKKIKSIKTDLERIADTRRRLEGFLETVWKQLQEQETVEKFSLAQEIEQVLQMISHTAYKHQIELFFHKNTEISTVNSFAKFNKIISNLVINAIDAYEWQDRTKFSRKKKVVKITLSRVGNKAVIKVRDWGKGIPPQLVDKIFDPFFSTKKSKKMGAGIGLFLTKEMVENSFGGELSVKSSRLKGTVFTIKFAISAEPKGV